MRITWPRALKIVAAVLFALLAAGVVPVEAERALYLALFLWIASEV